LQEIKCKIGAITIARKFSSTKTIKGKNIQNNKKKIRMTKKRLKKERAPYEDFSYSL